MDMWVESGGPTRNGGTSGMSRRYYHPCGVRAKGRDILLELGGGDTIPQRL